MIHKVGADAGSNITEDLLRDTEAAFDRAVRALTAVS
jgi:hypothetical protein